MFVCFYILSDGPFDCLSSVPPPPAGGRFRIRISAFLRRQSRLLGFADDTTSGKDRSTSSSGQIRLSKRVAALRCRRRLRLLRQSAFRLRMASARAENGSNQN